MGGRLPRQTANTIAARNCARSKDQSTNTTIIANGHVGSSDVANTLPEEGHADLVALGKSGLANRNWPERVRTGAALDAPSVPTEGGLATVKDREFDPEPLRTLGDTTP